MSEKPRALVTGGGKRIGAAIVRRLAELNFAVTIHVLNSRSEAGELIKTLPDSGQHSVTVADLSIPQERQQWLASLPGFDLAVNNASVYRLTAPGTEESARARERYWQTNYLAPLEITDHLLQKLSPSRQQALVVNLLDCDILTPDGGLKAAVEPPSGMDSYLYSRIMLGRMTKVLAAEKALALRINAIAPGPVLPPVNCSTPGMTRILDSVPLHRPAGVEEIADAVEFFWKNPSLTGVILPVDGGKHLNN